MKRLLFSIFMVLILLFPAVGFCAVNAATVWEWRYDGTAGNLNSCGFVAGATGTDWSQYATCKVSWVAASAGECAQASPTNTTNDLTCTNAAASICTSATYNFAAADVGNAIHVTSGTKAVAGWYEIVSVATNAATMSGNMTDTTGDATAMTGRMGGACSMNSTLDDEFFDYVVAGNTIYVKYNASAIATGETIAIPASTGTYLLPVSIIGYNASRADNPTGTSRPTINPAGNGFSTGSGISILKNLIFTTTSALGIQTSGIVDNVKVTNSSGSADQYGMYHNGNGCVFNSEFISTLGAALHMHANGTVVGSVFHDSKTGIELGGASDMVGFNTIYNISLYGINIASWSTNKIYSNSLYAAASPPAGSIGIRSSSTVTFGLAIFNNIIMNFETGGSLGAADLAGFYDYNNFYGNTTPRSNWPVGAHDTALDPGFVSAATGNFAIGTNLKAKGYPGTWQIGSTGYVDIGAVQRKEPTLASGF